MPADPSNPETNARRQKCTAGYSDKCGSPDGTMKASKPRLASSSRTCPSAATRCAAVAPAMVLLPAVVLAEVLTAAASGAAPRRRRGRGKGLWVVVGGGGGWGGVCGSLGQERIGTDEKSIHRLVYRSIHPSIQLTCTHRRAVPQLLPPLPALLVLVAVEAPTNAKCRVGERSDTGRRKPTIPPAVDRRPPAAAAVAAPRSRSSMAAARRSPNDDEAGKIGRKRKRR